MSIALREFFQGLAEDNGGAIPITNRRFSRIQYSVPIGAAQSEVKVPILYAGRLFAAVFRSAVLTTGETNLTLAKCGAGQAAAAATPMTAVLPARTGHVVNTNTNFAILATAAANVAVGDSIIVLQSASTVGGVGLEVVLEIQIPA